MCLLTLSKTTATYDLQFIEGSPITTRTVTYRYETDEYVSDALIAELLNMLVDVAIPADCQSCPSDFTCQHVEYHDGSEVDATHWHVEGLPDDLARSLFECLPH